MPMLRLIFPARGSRWKSSFRLRMGSPPNGSTCSNMGFLVERGRCSGSERGLDVGAHRLGRVGRRVALDDLAVLADQELGEVPLDRLRAEKARLLLGQPFPERMCAATVHLDLGHHRKRHAVVALAEA